MEATAENIVERQPLLSGLFAMEDENALEPYFACNEGQRRFIDELLADPRKVAYKAYMRAYGVGPETARANASRLLSDANIQRALEVRAAQAAALRLASVEAVVDELLGVAHSDIADYVDLQGGVLSIKDLKALPPGASRALSEISRLPTKHGVKIQVKLWSKERALEMLGRYLAMFKDVKEFSGPGGGPIDLRNMSDEDLSATLKSLGVVVGG